jgi:hypothetical protein
LFSAFGESDEEDVVVGRLHSIPVFVIFGRAAAVADRFRADVGNR